MSPKPPVNRWWPMRAHCTRSPVCMTRHDSCSVHGQQLIIASASSLLVHKKKTCRIDGREKRDRSWTPGVSRKTSKVRNQPATGKRRWRWRRNSEIPFIPSPASFHPTRSLVLRISNLVLIIVIAISGETNVDPQARSRFIPINHVRKFLQRLP